MSDRPPTETADACLLNVVATAFCNHCSSSPLPVAVAVSGGGDSMALLHLMHRTAPEAGYDLHPVTVDHGLRPESAAEAAQVAQFCKGLGIPHDTLRWQGPEPTGNLMDQARRARLSLIADWAKTHGISHVALGHTADDQAETFLMNLARAAGLDGLSGMRPDWTEQGIHWHRPLWRQTRGELREYLCRHDVTWIEDPSNDLDRFTRVKARRALQALRPLGIGVSDIVTSTQNLADARRGLQMALSQVVETHVTEHAGMLRLSQDSLCLIGTELRRRLLIQAIRWMNGTGYPPRAKQIQQLIMALDARRSTTLAGVWFRQRDNQILISREPKSVMGPVPFGQIWDHRWQITGPGRRHMTVAALGAEGLRQCPDWRSFGPRDSLIVSPAIWDNTGLIAAPLARKEPEWRAILSPSFGMFLIAH